MDSREPQPDPRDTPEPPDGRRMRATYAAVVAVEVLVVAGLWLFSAWFGS